MATKILSLEGLSDSKLGDLVCQLVGTLPGVAHAEIDFLSQRMTLEIEGRDSAATVSEVVDTLKAALPELKIGFTGTGEDTPVPEAVPMPSSRQSVEYLDEDDGEDDGEQGKEDADRQEPEEQRLPYRRPINQEIISCLAGLVIASACWGISAAFGGGGLSMMLSLASFLICAGLSILAKPGRRHAGTPAAALIAVVSSGAAFLAGARDAAALAMMVYLGTSLVLLLLYDRFDSSVEGILDVSPGTVICARDGIAERVPPAQVLPGDLLVIDAETTIPFDGVILEGSSQVEPCWLMGGGETMALGAGSPVSCGDYNLDSTLVIEVGASYEEATAAKVQANVLDAPPDHTAASLELKKWAAIFTATMSVATVAVALLYAQQQYSPEWVTRSAVLLLLASPCGLAGTVRSVHLGGLVQTLRAGAVVSSAKCLEMLWRVKTVATGFTGLLTEGNFRVTGVRTKENIREKQMLEAAACVEASCEHPIARTITAYWEKMSGQKANPGRVGMREEIKGYGVRGVLDQKLVLVGSAKFMAEAGVEMATDTSGESCVYVSIQGDYSGKLVLSDPYRPGAEELAEELRELGVEKTVLLTACDAPAARVAGKELGMDEVYPELTLADRLVQLETLAYQEESPKCLLYAGDAQEVELFANPGINIALGRSAVSRLLGIADILIPGGELESITDVMRVAKWAKTAILANCILFFSGKAALIALAFVRELPLWAAALGNGLLALAIAANALGILRRGNKH